MKPNKLLFIDDEKSGDFISALQKGGYEVDLARDSGEAIVHFSQKQYDIILLDIMMGHGIEIPVNILARRTGIAFLRMIRKGEIPEVDPKIPVIVMTALGNTIDINDIQKSKVDEILQKPISPDDVLLYVNEILTLHHKKTENAV